MKRSISLVVAILMVLSSVAALSFTVSAEETPDFGFAGVQTGEGALRLIGWTDNAEYDNVGFEVIVAGAAAKSKLLTTEKVFTSLKGNDTVVAATKGSGVEAAVVIEHEYLYGYGIENIADGEYTFTVVPTATKGEETVKAAAAKYAVSIADGEVTVGKLAVAPISVNGSKATVDYNGGQEFDAGVAGLFDGSWATKLCATFSAPMTITWELDEAKVMTKYELVSGNDHTTHPGRDPKAWTLSASNDGETWTVIDEITNNAFDANTTAYEFALDTTTAYKYFKMEITENNGAPHIQFMEIIPYAETVETVTEEQVAIKNVTGAADAVAGSVANLFDGDLVGSKVCEVGVVNWWVSVELENAVAVNRYKIGSANDWDDRDPKNWTVYGSNDGETWTVLDEMTEQGRFGVRSTLYTYDMDNTTAYKFYKFEVAGCQSTDPFGLDIVQISEWQLFVVE